MHDVSQQGPDGPLLAGSPEVGARALAAAQAGMEGSGHNRAHAELHMSPKLPATLGCATTQGMLPFNGGLIAAMMGSVMGTVTAR